MRDAVVLAGALLLAGCVAQARDIPELRGIGVPDPVKALIGRRIDCSHWAGEDPYDAARAREIAGMLDRLRCDSLDADAARLKVRYGDDPRVAATLDQSATW